MGDGRLAMTTFQDITLHKLETEDTEKLTSQVAGHTQTGGVLKHKEGYLLKPLPTDLRGIRELNFYTTVNDNNNESEVLSMLRQIIPNFHGVATMEQTGDAKGSGKFLMLEDVSSGFSHPCIVDVKIGVQTWNPTATAEKIANEKSKYVGTKSTLGISITGMHYYDIQEKIPVRKENGFGKKLDQDSVIDVFADFLNGKVGVHRFIAERILARLKAIEKFFEIQKEFTFYGSSLLIAYDAKFVEDLKADPSRRMELDLECAATDDSWLRIYMIDFAHVFPLEPPAEQDTNYMFGLSNFVKLMSGFVEGKYDAKH